MSKILTVEEEFDKFKETLNVYETSKNLGSEDFMDLAVCKANALGLGKELEKHREQNKTK